MLRDAASRIYRVEGPIQTGEIFDSLVEDCRIPLHAADHPWLIPRLTLTELLREFQRRFNLLSCGREKFITADMVHPAATLYFYANRPDSHLDFAPAPRSGLASMKRRQPVDDLIDARVWMRQKAKRTGRKRPAKNVPPGSDRVVNPSMDAGSIRIAWH